MSAQAGWYPDPGGGQDLYRYWDGQAWSAATSPHPSAPPPVQGLIGSAQPPASGQSFTGQSYGAASYGHQGYGAHGDSSSGGGTASLPGATPLGGATGAGSAYAAYQQTAQKRSPVGWWLAGAALVLVIVVVGVFTVRAATNGGAGLPPTLPGGQATQEVCPIQDPSLDPDPDPNPNDGRVHGGPVSYPELGAPWSAPSGDNRVPFGSDVQVQQVTVEPDYAGPGSDWVASILVAELQAGDGFFSPQQGSAVVVKCILGQFYGPNPVSSDVQRNEATTIDGREAWLVESQLSFDIEGLETKGELLIVAIVSAGATSGLYYASIPDTRPELVRPARDALARLQVDG